MNASWERIRALFHAALEQPADARTAFLASACDGDEAIRREVESLLGAHRAANQFLESPAIGFDGDRSVAATAALQPGDRIGNFEVIGSLGAGGMGEVYRARDVTLRREVAIKLLPRALAEDPQRLARFERESRILAALNHPHIATIHSVEHAEGVQIWRSPFLLKAFEELVALAAAVLLAGTKLCRQAEVLGLLLRAEAKVNHRADHRWQRRSSRRLGQLRFRSTTSTRRADSPLGTS